MCSLYLACVAVSCSRRKNLLKPEIPVLRSFKSGWAEDGVIREMGGDYNGVLGRGVGKATIVLALEAEMFERFVYCIRSIFPDGHPDLFLS